MNTDLSASLKVADRVEILTLIDNYIDILLPATDIVTRPPLAKEGKKVLWDEKTCIRCDKCIKICPKNASPRVRKYEVEELVAELKKVAPFLRGITISGGEATLQYKEIS